MHRLNVRLIVGAPSERRSSVWRLWSNKNDVYLAFSNMGGITKFSFHESGRCREAFTKEHGFPQGEDRAKVKWWRAPTPEPDGSGRASCVMQVGFPTATLSASLKAESKKIVIWVDPAPTEMITVIEMMFTREELGTLNSILRDTPRKVVAYSHLPNDETFLITRRHATWTGKAFGMPASHRQAKDFIFSSDDPQNTGLPVRMFLYAPPKDGDALIGWEHGGYSAPAGTWERIRPKGT